MSEFTKLAARLEHVHTSATALRERYMAEDAPTVADTVVADHHAAQALHDELTITLLPGVAKFHTKIHATDPVTGIERFGPQMKAKIVALAEQMEAVVTVCAATLETIEPLARRAREMQMAKEQLAAAAAAAEAHAEQAAAATAVAAADAAAAAAASAGAAAAAEQREQRRLAEETRCRRKHLSSVLQRLLTLLNERPRGAAATASALTRLQASCLDAPTLTAALRTATTILEGISARPDNALLRRLRLFHPDLHGRLLRHDGGVALLLAVGFHIKVMDASAFAQEQERLVQAGGALGAFSRDLQDRADRAIGGGRGPAGTTAAAPSAVRGGSGEGLPRVDRVYARVTVRYGSGHDTSGEFTVTYGVDADASSGSSSSGSGGSGSGSGNSGNSGSSGSRGSSGSSGSSSDSFTACSTGGDAVAAAIVGSTDVDTWPAHQQDYSELLFLCRAATNAAPTVAGVADAAFAGLGAGALAVPQVAVLTMTEPSPDTADGMQAWLEWFDGLKASADSIARCLPP